MSVSPLFEWRLPSCGIDCAPRRHDPRQHDLHSFLRGFLLATWTPPTRVIRTGPLVIDLDAGTVIVDGQDVRLSGREWGILAYLAERVGTWCPIADLVAEVWGPEWIGVQVLSVTAYRLRRKLGSAGRLLTTNNDSWAPMRRLEWEPPK